MNTTYPLGNLLVILSGGMSAKRRLLDAACEYASLRPIYLFDNGKAANELLTQVVLFFENKRREEPLQPIYRWSTYTCQQMAEILEDIRLGYQPMRAVFIIDFLESFYDPGTPYPQAKMLLEYSLECLQDISQTVPVILTASPAGQSQKGRRYFFNIVSSSANLVRDETSDEVEDLDWMAE